MNDALEGAFTGEISAKMVKEAGGSFAILGHSERRHVFGETDAFINKKVKRALSENLQPIFCLGETGQEREAGKTESVLERQLSLGLEGVRELKNLVLAYEPVWAIGTGKVAQPMMPKRHIAFAVPLFGNTGGIPLPKPFLFYMAAL